MAAVDAAFLVDLRHPFMRSVLSRVPTHREWATSLPILPANWR